MHLKLYSENFILNQSYNIIYCRVRKSSENEGLTLDIEFIHFCEANNYQSWEF